MQAQVHDRRRRPLAWFLALVILVGSAAVLTYLRRESPVPPAPPEPLLVDASRLVRLNGRLVYREDTNQVFAGWITESYPDGTLKSRSEVSDGALNGLSEGFHTNGVLQVREHFVDGVSEGLIQKWHADGTRLSEGTARQGQLEGTFRRWHPNGVLAEEIILRGGQPEGASRAWFPSGAQKAEVELRDGAVVRQTFWNDGERPAANLTQSQAPPP
ncbi:MAG: toxin-antitoxin system YwqK family antitoxin [Limisphaerales bacterium]